MGSKIKSQKHEHGHCDKHEERMQGHERVRHCKHTWLVHFLPADYWLKVLYTLEAFIDGGVMLLIGGTAYCFHG